MSQKHVDDDQVKSLFSKFEELEPDIEELTIPAVAIRTPKDVIIDLKTEIQRVRKTGVSWEKVLETINSDLGTNISLGTLKSYMYCKKKDTVNSKTVPLIQGDLLQEKL